MRLGGGETKLVCVIESISLGSTTCEVTGWVCWLPGGRVPERALLSQDGEDLAELRPSAPRRLPASDEPVGCGFVAEFAPGARRLTPERFVVRSAGGDTATMLLPAPAVGTLVARGRIERCSGEGIGGWLYAPEQGEIRPPIIACEGLVIPFRPDRPRPDLVAAGIVGREKVGFSVEFGKRPLRDLIGGDRRGAGRFDPAFALLFEGRLLDSVSLSGRRLEFAASRLDATGTTGRVRYLRPMSLPTRAGPRVAEPGGSVAADGVRRIDLAVNGCYFGRIHPDDPVPAPAPGADRTGQGIAVEWGPHALLGASVHLSLRDPDSGLETTLEQAVEAVPPPAFRLPDLPETDRPVTLIVPVHNAGAALRRCLESVFANTTLPTRLLLVDDASTDPEVLALLETAARRPGVEVRRNASRLGFARSVDGAIRAVGADVVLLNSDAEVGPRWLENLLLVARALPRTGTVTPLSNNAGMFSVPACGIANDLPAGDDRDRAARRIAQAAVPLWPDVGTGNGFCLFVAWQCYLETGGFDLERFGAGYGEETDFCLRAGRLGWQHRIDDRTYVVHEREASFGTAARKLKRKAVAELESSPEFSPLANQFAVRDDLNLLRMRILRSIEAPAPAVRPRLLFVTSTQTGGTPKTNADLMEALADRYQPYLLSCDSLRLTLRSGESGDLVATHLLQRRIDPVLHASDEYDRIVASWLVEHAIELVHIRHLAWHGLGLPAVCRKLSIPTVFSFHDFYMICPTVKLIDETGVHCQGRCTAPGGDCSSELWDGRVMPALKHRYIGTWKARSEQVLASCDAFVTTSQSAATLIEDAFPSLAGRVAIIRHGRSFARMAPPPAPAAADAPFRILLAGSVSAAKGLGIVVEAARRLAGQGFEFHVLGRIDPTMDAGPLIVHGPYPREAFVERAAALGARIGLIPSLWPETYSHVLTEMWAAGLPVLGSGLGAIGERIEETGAGWLVDPEPDAIIAALTFIRANPEDLVARGADVALWQAGPGAARDVAAMAGDYAALYADVIDRRRSFGRLDLAQPTT